MVEEPIRLELFADDVTAITRADLDDLARRLRTMLEQDVAVPVDAVAREALPAGAKTAELTLAAQIVLQLVPIVAPRVMDVLAAWVKQLHGRSRAARVNVRVGNRSVRLSPQMTSAELAQAKRAGSELIEAADGGRRLALLVGNAQYVDPLLTQLTAPAGDVQALAELLRRPDVGAFDEVSLLVDRDVLAIRQAIERLFQSRRQDDLVLLYFSGHGVKGDTGELYLAARDTRQDLLRSTGIAGDFITAVMDRCRARRKVVILDCCYSGAFVQAKGAMAGAAVHAAEAFRGSGYGQVVITASDRMQYAWEGDRVHGQPLLSTFTRHLIDGLRSGGADSDGDGFISLTELYHYVYDRVIERQTPNMSTTDQQGHILIARNPAPQPKLTSLPADVRVALESRQVWQRQGAVLELERLLLGGDPGVARAAQGALTTLVADDSRTVSAEAQRALGRAGVEVEKPDTRQYSRRGRSTPAAEPAPLRVTQDDVAVPASNTSGMGAATVVPAAARGWHWGAFLLNVLWGLGNRTYVALLMFIPFPPVLAQLAVMLLLGAKGREWAWRYRRWESVAAFEQAQARWTRWAVILYAAVFLLFGCALLFN